MRHSTRHHISSVSVYRYLFFGLLLIAAWIGMSDTASAQAGLSDITENDMIKKMIVSGMALVIALVMAGGAMLLYLIWIYTGDWMNRDGQNNGIKGYKTYNAIYFVCFAISAMLLLLLPIVGLPTWLIFYLPCLIAYVRYRNRVLDDPNDMVWSKRHLKRWFGKRMAIFGVKVDEEEKDRHSIGVPVILESCGGETDRDDRVHLLKARQCSGFGDARLMVADALTRQADAIMLDFTKESCDVKHQIDGVWHPDHAWERELADEALVAFKTLCGVNPEDRRSRQSGSFLAKYEVKFKIDGTMTSQGTNTGERVLIELKSRETPFEKPDDLGLREEQARQIIDHLNSPQGFAVFSAMPANGLKSSMNVLLRALDRFTREFNGCENAKNKYELIENILVQYYNGDDGLSAIQVLDDIFLKEPQAVICRDLDSAEVVKRLYDEVPKERMIISTTRAKDCVEAILRILAMKVDPAEFASQLSMVVNQRLIRKLCPECKDAYQPNPKLLQQLGLPPAKVKTLYRPHKTNVEEKEEVCHHCEGLGYSGRTALFEIMMVDDSIRKALAGSSDPNLIRQVARKAGMRSLQQEGILLAARGITSIEEVQRVMKQ